MIPVDPPVYFRDGQVLDPVDINDNVHHWVNLIKRVADRRYVHSAANLSWFHSTAADISENLDINKRSIRWYCPIDVYVENLSLFVNQSGATTATLQVTLAKTAGGAPTGLSSSIVFSEVLSGATTNVQVFSKSTGFVLKKDTNYDIVHSAAALTYDLRMLEIQLTIRTDRWATDSARPTSTRKRIDGSATVAATDVNSILADVESDIATCNSNDYNWVPNCYNFGGAHNQNASTVHQTHHDYPVTGDAGVNSKWGGVRINAIQHSISMSITAADTATLTSDLRGNAATVLLRASSILTASGAESALLATYATTATDVTAASTARLDDENDDFGVVSRATKVGGATVNVHVWNTIVWER